MAELIVINCCTLARPADSPKSRVLTLSPVKLGRNYTSVLVCYRTNRIAQGSKLRSHLDIDVFV